MKTSAYHITIALVTLLTACQSGLPVKSVYTGKVTKVHDGDSMHITPAGEERVIIRLAAIDAPEINQRHGVVSRDYLRTMVFGRSVTARCNKIDKYRRQICVVLKDGKDINIEMLNSGNAWYYTKYQNEQSSGDRRAYKKSERKARLHKKGLWQNADITPPWEYRAAIQ